MDRPRIENRVAGLLALIACVAFNLWLFRLGPLAGLIGLNLTKHVAIAAVCRNAGVNRKDDPNSHRRTPLGRREAPARPVPGVAGGHPGWAPGIDGAMMPPGRPDAGSD